MKQEVLRVVLPAFQDWFVYSRNSGKYKVYELMNETAAQVLLDTETGDSISALGEWIQRPYETIRQGIDRLEDAGFVDYDDA